MAEAQAYSNNDKWVKRIEDAFDQLNHDRNGYVTRENYMKSLTELPQDIAKDRPEHLAKARSSLEELLDELGLIAGMKADKAKYIELSAVFAAAEANRLAKGELTFLEKCDHAFFDMMDLNSNGFLSFDEYKVLIQASGLEDNSAQAAFDLLDKDGNGKLDKREYAAADVKFWCQLDSSENDGLFGSKIR